MWPGIASLHISQSTRLRDSFQQFTVRRRLDLFQMANTRFQTSGIRTTGLPRRAQTLAIRNDSCRQRLRQHSDSSSYSVIHIYSTYVLDLTGSNPSPGTKVILYADFDTNNQRWKIRRLEPRFVSSFSTDIVAFLGSLRDKKMLTTPPANTW